MHTAGQGRGGEENREFASRDRKLTDSYSSAEGMVNRVSDDLGIDADRYLGMYHDGLMMSGGLGFVGEMLVDIANQTDNGYYGMWRTATAIGGPSVSLGGRAVRVLGGVQDAAFDAMGFESTNYKERDAFDASFGLVPFVGQMPAVKENLKRTPRPPCKLVLKEPKDDLRDYTYDDIHLIGYHPYPSIKAEMAV